MSEKDRQIADSMREAVKLLPPDKKEYVLGYAEGVLAAASKDKPDDQPADTTK